MWVYGLISNLVVEPSSLQLLPARAMPGIKVKLNENITTLLPYYEFHSFYLFFKKSKVQFTNMREEL